MRGRLSWMPGARRLAVAVCIFLLVDFVIEMPVVVMGGLMPLLNLAENPEYLAYMEMESSDEAMEFFGLITFAVVVLSLIGLLLEIRFGADQLAGNVAFLALWAVFLRDGVTPLDDWQEISKAVLPSALFGWGAVGGLAYLGVKATATAARKADVPEPEPEPPADEPSAAESDSGGRRRRRRRRKSDS